MKRIFVIASVVVLTGVCAACTTTPGDGGVKVGKIADQRLAAYTPIRRVTYRDVCSSEGPLTVCIDRISMSETSTLVEARIRNASPQPYLQGNMKEASVLLADDTGRSLIWENREPMEYQGLEERIVHFKMAGHFSGEPSILMMNNIKRKSPRDKGREFSIVARLGG